MAGVLAKRHGWFIPGVVALLTTCAAPAASPTRDPCDQYRQGSAAEVFVFTNDVTPYQLCSQLVKSGFPGADVVNRWFLIQGRGTTARLFRAERGRWRAFICGRVEDLYTFDSFRAGNNLSQQAWNEIDRGCSAWGTSSWEPELPFTDSMDCRYRRTRAKDRPAPENAQCR